MIPSSVLELIPKSEQADFEAASRRHAPRAIRIKPSVSVQSLPFPSRPVAWHGQGRWLDDPAIRPSQFLEYAVGDYYIQDAGSLLALSLLNPKPNEHIADLCAAPGGKATAIAEALSGSGFLLANEAIRSRVDTLCHLMSRVGTLRYAITNQDPSALGNRFAGCFDAVLVDAPCSGQTLLAADKRAANAYSDNQIIHCAQRQERILDAALKLIRPGGRLVYSTCTFSIEENEQQIERLLKKYPSCLAVLTSPNLEPWKSEHGDGCYRLWPHRDPSAGAFAAGLTLIDELPKKIEDRQLSGLSQKDRLLSIHGPKKLRSKIWQQLRDLGTWGNEVEIFEQPTREQLSLRATDRRYQSWLHDRLAIEEYPKLATASGKTLRPESSLAYLTPNYFQAARLCDLSDQAAKTFLRGEALPADLLFLHNLPSVNSFDDDSETDWLVATWHCKALGWLKRGGNRLNNHLPTIDRRSMSNRPA